MHNWLFKKMKDRRKFVWRKESKKEKSRIKQLKIITSSWTNKIRKEPKNGLTERQESRQQWVEWLILLVNRIKKKKNKMIYAFYNMLRKETGNNWRLKLRKKMQ